ncbi:MAG: lysophospholipid acyltransferase family protein [Deltaproteobacteria bacterium]|nr:lysophospholipid acyltransferase family protein [Deltaproteobacteria bacterium]
MKKETLTTMVVFIIFRAIPLNVRRALFKALAVLFYRVSEKHRLIVLHNLARSFPEKDISDLAKIARDSYRSVGILAAEFFDLLPITGENISDWLEFEGRENYLRAKEKNKGILFFTGHFGNWELEAAAFAILCEPLNIVYRVLDNPVIGEIVDKVRSHRGNRLVSKGGAVRKILELLKKNEVVGILIDQNVSWREGVFVDFFGRPASTTKGLAALALQTGAPVLPGFIFRMKDGKYRFVIEPEIEISRTGDYDRDIFENTQRFTKIVEGNVRRHPEQWFWLHQRWKTKKSQVPANKPTP